MKKKKIPKETAMSFRLDEDLRLKFKGFCEKKGYKMSFILTELMSLWMKGKIKL